MVAKKLITRLSVSWQTALYGLVTVSIVGLLLFAKLGSLVPATQSELRTYQNAQHLSDIINNPLNAPYKLARIASVKSSGKASPASLRISSALFALIFALCFYYVLKNWLTKRMAILGTLLFISSSWFLHVARSGTNDISQWTLIALVAYGVWVIKTRRFDLAVILGVVTAALALYTPGLIWLVMAALIWQRKRLKQIFVTSSNIFRISALLLAVVLIAPLVVGFVMQPSLILDWLGLPRSLPSLTAVLNDIVSVPLNLFIKGPDDPSLWVSSLPILDIFASAMVILGAYSYYFRLRLDRVRLLTAALVFGSILIALGGPVTITILIPLVYVLVANGFTLMAQQWFTVFPRNPIARLLGLILITATVLLSVYYQLTHYFVAWPNAPSTQAIFSASVGL